MDALMNICPEELVPSSAGTAVLAADVTRVSARAPLLL